METCEKCQRPEVCKYAGRCLTPPATEGLIARRSAADSLDVADCCVSLDEARGVIRRREIYADDLISWMDERRNAAEFTTLGMIQEKLRPLCSKRRTHEKSMKPEINTETEETVQTGGDQAFAQARLVSGFSERLAMEILRNDMKITDARLSDAIDHEEGLRSLHIAAVGRVVLLRTIKRELQARVDSISSANAESIRAEIKP
jgi:hypothetical protein